jgi:hypothetical protein
VWQQATHPSRGALIDRGANGGIAGSDTRIITESEQRVDLSGIDSHKSATSNLVMQVLSFAQHGEVIVIMNNYALVSEHKTIHSSAQIESYKNKVDDRPYFWGNSLHHHARRLQNTHAFQERTRIH